MGKFKDSLYLAKRNIFLQRAWKRGLIKPFDDSLYERMKKYFVACLPVSIMIKYFKPEKGDPGQCIERSLYLLVAFDNPVLVRGNRKDLEILYGKEEAFHGWVENDGWVYDPTSLCMFRKDIYYKAYGVSDVKCFNKEQYSSSHIYNNIINSKIEDYKPYGKNRTDLLTALYFTKKIAELKSDENFIKELNEYFEEIEYDIDEIIKEQDEELDKVFKDKGKRLV